VNGTGTILDTRPTGIYLVLDEDGYPLYVGKSLYPDSRCRGHLKTFPAARAYFILHWVSHYEWQRFERAWIKYFRELGFSLENKNPGGGGLTHLSREQRDHLRQVHLGKKESVETREKKRQAMLGKKQSELSNLRRSVAMLGKEVKPEVKDRLREKAQVQWKRKQAEGYRPTAESNEKRSKAAKKNWENPEHRQKHIDAQKDVQFSEQALENIRLAQQRRRARENSINNSKGELS